MLPHGAVEREDELRLVRRIITAALLGLAILGSACGTEGGKDLFDTAQFEERQNNQAHAKELYEQIIVKYPQSEYAKKAEERLQAFAVKP
ncbi:MAG: tetratricopeptide repeat protein [Nitrospiraceae bacterium]